ncbi:hypothetical protein GCM10009785_13770 [Brooklawnia cerclae]|uniref:Uncharacterized protein n=1 Tax=Brooklawnia cerclae TaxID=349934 RepID=A0ABX0SJF6_9ACTN|nr:hypothetical protein [Brooklawnia cerclae]NIH58513.1 hypothetical protein [Brooklawnia cerclae]
MSATAHTLRRPDPEPHHIEGAATCGNGHPWRPETTRWRLRTRGGRHGSGWERDCLVCKDVADKARAQRRQGSGLVFRVTKSGTSVAR